MKSISRTYIVKWKDINTTFYNKETHMASLAVDQEAKLLGNDIDIYKKLICSTTLIDFNGVMQN